MHKALDRCDPEPPFSGRTAARKAACAPQPAHTGSGTGMVLGSVARGGDGARSSRARVRRDGQARCGAPPQMRTRAPTRRGRTDGARSRRHPEFGRAEARSRLRYRRPAAPMARDRFVLCCLRTGTLPAPSQNPLVVG